MIRLAKNLYIGINKHRREVISCTHIRDSTNEHGFPLVYFWWPLFKLIIGDPTSILHLYEKKLLDPIELRGKKAGVLTKKHVIDGFVIMQMVEMLLDLLMLREVNLKWFKGILNKEEDRTFCSFIFRFVCDRVKYVLKDK